VKLRRRQFTDENQSIFLSIGAKPIDMFDMFYSR
jgi:hypothetical protein